MNRLKKIIIIILMICSLSIIPVVADSGWDNDYSSSSSDWGSSSSDWGSSSSWGSSNDYDTEVDPGFTILVFLVIVGFFIVSIFLSVVIKAIQQVIDNKIAMIKSSKKVKQSISYRFKLFNTHEIGDIDSKIQKYFPELNERILIEKLYDKFVEVQSAWMNFDYDSLKRLCSDELFNSYKSDLKVLSLSNGKNVMNDFTLLAANIDNIKEENNTIIIDAYIYVSFLDFVVNVKEKRLTKGNIKTPIFSSYDLKFIVSKNPKSIICPGCGAELKPGVNQCSYCNTKINGTYGDFVLSVKKKK